MCLFINFFCWGYQGLVVPAISKHYKGAIFADCFLLRLHIIGGLYFTLIVIKCSDVVISVVLIKVCSEQPG